MAKNDKDLKIGVATVYDGSGAQRALDDMERVKTAAAELPQGGGTTAAELPPAQTQGEKDLAAATQTAATAAAEATKATAALTEARTQGKPAADKATAAEKELAGALKEGAAASVQVSAAEKAAAIAANTTAAAATQTAAAHHAAADATDEEEQKAAALERAMKLEALGVRKLEALLQRLIVARQKAAEAGDTAAYKKLALQCDQVREGLMKMKQGMDMNALGMLNQAQVGMQLSSSLMGIAKGAADGTLTLNDMVGGVTSLSLAIKAGMGPVGWLMAALQALPVMWEGLNVFFEDAPRDFMSGIAEKLGFVTEHLLEVEEKEHNATLAKWDAEIERLENRQAVAKKDMDAAAKSFEDRLNERVEGIKKEADTRKRAREEAERAASAEDDRRKTALDSELAAARHEIELRQAGGQISAAEAAEELHRIQRAHDERMAGIEQEAAQRQKDAAELESKQAFYDRHRLKETLAELDGLLEIKLPTTEEYAALQERIAKGLGSADSVAQRREWNEKIDLVRGELEKLGINFEGSEEDVLAFAEKMKSIRKNGDAVAEELLKTHRAAADEAKGTQRAAESAQQKADADARAADAAREVARAQEENARLAEEWAGVSRGSFAEQRVWLEEVKGRFAEGSEAAKKWTEQLRQVKLKEVQDALSRLDDNFKVTGNYAEEDKRLQAQIHVADMRALQERRKKLQALAASPDIDAATLRQINDKLKETDRQTRGLRDAMHKSADAAAQAVNALKPLGQKATVKGAQSALKRLEKGYTRMAQNAARQASRGDMKGLDRSIAAMKRNALAQERLTGHSGRAAAHMRQTEGYLRAIAVGTRDEERGLTAQQRQRRAVERALGVESRQQKRKGEAVKQAGDAAKKEAAARKKAAQQAAREQAKKKPQKTTQDIGDLTAKMNEATQQLAEMQGKIAAMSASVSQLADAARGCAAAATNAANTAAGKVAALKSELNAVKAAVNNLRRS